MALYRLGTTTTVASLVITGSAVANNILVNGNAAFNSSFSLDGYEIDLSSGATSGQALIYNGTSFVPTLPAPSGITSIIAATPLTGGTITSTGTIGLSTTGPGATTTGGGSLFINSIATDAYGRIASLTTGTFTTGNFTFTGNTADLTSAGVMNIGSTNTTAVQVPGTIQAPTSTDLVLAANGGGNPFVFESSGAHNALFFGAKGFGVTIQADAGGMFISNSGLSTIRLANGWVGSNSDLFESSGFSTNRWTQTWTESVNNTGSVSLISSAADSGTSVAAIIDTSTNWATIGAKLLSVRNDGVEKAFIGFDGSINGLIVNNSYATTSRPSASSVSAGTQIYDTTLTIPVWSDGSNWRNAAGIVS